MFDALVFVIHDVGFFARSAWEINNARNRFNKILEIIADCKYGIHDISRTELGKFSLPRFNMPLELGIYLGCMSFGNQTQQSKSCLILDRVGYRYRQSVSDLAGHDISYHNNKPEKAIGAVRDWLSTESGGSGIPGKTVICKRYQSFRKDLPNLCEKLKTRVKDLTFTDYRNIVRAWVDNLPA